MERSASRPVPRCPASQQCNTPEQALRIFLNDVQRHNWDLRILQVWNARPQRK